jgi:hypothetical protein
MLLILIYLAKLLPSLPAVREVGIEKNTETAEYVFKFLNQDAEEN